MNRNRSLIGVSALSLLLLSFLGYKVYAACTAITDQLVANPNTINSGGMSTLTWSSTGAISCMGTGFSTGPTSPISGSVTVTPTATTTYSVNCSGAIASATVTVNPLVTGTTILTVSANGRYFQDQNGNAVYLWGDSPWTIVQNLNPSQQATYFNTRKSQGYNAILVDADDIIPFGNGINPCNGGHDGPADANGCNQPFTGTVNGVQDPATPNGAYWNNVDATLRLAQQSGMYVLLTVWDQYTPWFTFGTPPEPTSSLTAYGNFLGQRYGTAAFDNVMWMVGNDYNVGSTGNANAMAVVLQAIANNDHRHLLRFCDCQTRDGLSGSRNDPDGALTSLLNPVDSIYQYQSAKTWRHQYLNQYNMNPPFPMVNIESGYENNGDTGLIGGPMTENAYRDQHYVFMLSGATGDMTGNNSIWQFQGDWQSALTTQGAREFAIFIAWMKTFPWWQLTPDQNGTVFQGLGNPADFSGAFANNNLAISYWPSTGNGTFNQTVNMNYFSGTVTAKWFNPTTGGFTTIGTGMANTGTHTFTSPGNNGTGDNDFVLFLTSP